MQSNLTPNARENILRKIANKHPDWVFKASDFMGRYSTQMNLNSFCQMFNLPYNDFKDFYELMVKDIDEEIENNPFLKQLNSLPLEYQDEYTKLKRKRRKLLIELAEIESQIIDEKIAIGDYYDKAKSLEIDAKLKKSLNKKNVDHLLGALRSKQIFNEMDIIDDELEQFYRRHGIE